MKNWFCKPASEDEAVEIVERALANGAVAKEVPRGFDFVGNEFSWDYCDFWGVDNGKTITHDCDVPTESGEQLTIQQVREQFPLPHEVNDMSDKKEWQGPQDGFPPIGFHGEIKWGKNLKYLECVVIPDNTVAMLDNGKWVVAKFFGDAKFRPLRTEREKWIDDVVKVWSEHPGDPDDSFAGVIYDAIKSGALKAPEVE